ncbi:uncharacterized protein PHALS_09444 [Plasmopara halstedii]|uniref:Uncharacterized protein n=1 Tax=Plasmopara halstedii TaxID=4781 RepID=A0A0P1A5F0_PLAHL|nr:uncharacterized protein PHALS_09444 [Plasmopara halstedii]CEG35318.1 hypothetical protein PHALS_09444 [Plasmopara halstedii]|eukprot:XP_024571687.1 hypothetical protein PHALS_09444 [Plasmopara halstedii]
MGSLKILPSPIKACAIQDLIIDLENEEAFRDRLNVGLLWPWSVHISMLDMPAGQGNVPNKFVEADKVEIKETDHALVKHL